MKYQAILFDVDGTLIDSFPPYFKIMSRVLRKYRRSATPNELKRTFSMTLPRAFDFLKIPNNLQGVFETDYLSLKAQSNLTPSLFPGITSMFRKLEMTTLPGIGIVTSGGNQEVNELASSYSFMHEVWTIVTANTIPEHKPAPEPLLYAVDQMGIPASKALYVGDAPVDMAAARNAKMDFGIAGWGADPKAHFSSYEYYFKQPRDVLKLF